MSHLLLKKPFVVREGGDGYSGGWTCSLIVVDRPCASALLLGTELGSKNAIGTPKPAWVAAILNSFVCFCKRLNMQLSILIVSGSMASVQSRVDERINKRVVFLNLISVS